MLRPESHITVQPLVSYKETPWSLMLGPPWESLYGGLTVQPAAAHAARGVRLGQLFCLCFR